MIIVILFYGSRYNDCDKVTQGMIIMTKQYDLRYDIIVIK